MPSTRTNGLTLSMQGMWKEVLQDMSIPTPAQYGDHFCAVLGAGGALLLQEGYTVLPWVERYTPRVTSQVLCLLTAQVCSLEIYLFRGSVTRSVGFSPPHTTAVVYSNIFDFSLVLLIILNLCMNFTSRCTGYAVERKVMHNCRLRLRSI